MAVVQDFNNQQNNSNDQNQQTQPVSLSNNSAAPTMGSSNSSSVAPTIQNSNTPTSSGRFTNLQQYIKANQGYNSEGGGLAGQITSNLSDKTNNVQNQYNQAQQNFQQQAQQGSSSYSDYDPNKVQSAVSNASQYVSDPNNVKSFQNYLNANYQGPTSLDQGNQLQSQAQNLQSLGNLTQSESGRYSLLQNLYGTPSYTQGQQSLDNLFLQANPNQLQYLQQVTPLTQNLNSTINQGISNDENLVQQLQQQAQNVSKQTQGVLGGAITQFGQQASDAAKDAMQQRDASFQTAQQLLGQGKLSAQDLQKFGIQAGTQLYNIDPNQFLTENNQIATAQNIITPEQQAQINALSNLAGNSLSGDPTQIISQFQNNSKAGSFAQQPGYTFDADRFNKAISDAKNQYNEQYNQIQGNIQNRNNLINDHALISNYYNQNLGNVKSDFDNSMLEALKNLQNKYNVNENGQSSRTLQSV